MGEIALFDFVYQHRSFLCRMRMTAQEIKDEFKQGDPHIKSRRRSIAGQRARKRMMAAVPGSSVIVTNPTRYAVALRYAHGDMAAPVVVAKGVDAIALKIREIATQAGVPIVEPSLARPLFASMPQERHASISFGLAGVWPGTVRA
jgi:flagellar biosynthetic protein FlhB